MEGIGREVTTVRASLGVRQSPLGADSMPAHSSRPVQTLVAVLLGALLAVGWSAPAGAQSGLAADRAAADRLRAIVGAEQRRIAGTRAGLADAEARLAVIVGRVQRRQAQLTEAQDKLVRARIRLDPPAAPRDPGAPHAGRQPRRRLQVRRADDRDRGAELQRVRRSARAGRVPQARLAAQRDDPRRDARGARGRQAPDRRPRAPAEALQRDGQGGDRRSRARGRHPRRAARARGAPAGPPRRRRVAPGGGALPDRARRARAGRGRPPRRGGLERDHGGPDRHRRRRGGPRSSPPPTRSPPPRTSTAAATAAPRAATTARARSASRSPPPGLSAAR